MPTVNTATGPVDTASLGFTLMHEHIYVLTEGVVRDVPAPLESRRAYQAGGGAL